VFNGSSAGNIFYLGDFIRWSWLEHLLFSYFADWIVFDLFVDLTVDVAILLLMFELYNLVVFLLCSIKDSIVRDDFLGDILLISHWLFEFYSYLSLFFEKLISENNRGFPWPSLFLNSSYEISAWLIKFSFSSLSIEFKSSHKYLSLINTSNYYNFKSLFFVLELLYLISSSISSSSVYFLMCDIWNKSMDTIGLSILY